MPDTGRPPDLSTLTPGQLERARRDLAAALALARPGSPARLPIGTHLAAIDAELARRTSQRPSPATTPPNGERHMLIPGTQPGTEIDLEEVRGPLEDTRHLRMALDLLEERLPPAYTCDGLESELWALREKNRRCRVRPAPHHRAPRIPHHPAAHPSRRRTADLQGRPGHPGTR